VDLATTFQTAAAEAARLAPSVVAIGRGAGIVLDDDLVLTNVHNVGVTPLQARRAGGPVEDAEVVATDADHDLAVVRTPTEGRPAPAWAEGPPALGTPVLAIGAPRRGQPGRVTVGFVSSTDRPFRGPRGRRLSGIEHTAPRGRGSSGGPVVDLGGHVVGIDTHRLGGGFYLALPAGSELRQRVDALVRGESRTRKRIGIAVAPPAVARHLRASVGLDARDGVLVRDLDPDGPAHAAGVRVGDLVVGVDGTPVSSPDDLVAAIDDSGATLTLAIVRGVEEVEVVVPTG
jgi:serine protease Do